MTRPDTPPNRKTRIPYPNELPRGRVAARSKAIVPASDKRRLHRKIADGIGVEILSGKRAPGSLLPTEIEASQHLEVSRSAYREALRILVAKGLVQTRPKAGASVTPRQQWQILDPDVLRWVFENEPSEAFIRSLFELREILEPNAAALAATRRTPMQLARMGHALEEMARHGLATEAGRVADQAFHEEILKATGNEPLMTLTATIGATIHWTTAFKYRASKLPRDPLPEHRKLYGAIAEADPEGAMKAAQELVQLALQDTRLSLRQRSAALPSGTVAKGTISNQ
ncbi:MAG TPA: FadR/GntR family transcriptional regulator [Povalibacter sp.]